MEGKKFSEHFLISGKSVVWIDNLDGETKGM
jgi:hypothetical protein